MKTSRVAVERMRLRQDALEGRVAVVAGGGRGIGREIGRALAALGARVVIADTSDEGLEMDRIFKETSDTALFVRTDVADEANAQALCRTATEAFGPVDIIVNNPSFPPVASLLETDVATWDDVMAVNLRGAFLTCRTFLPGMLQRGRGTVINVVSTEPLPHLSAYSASTEGVAGLTKALAAEVGNTGVRVIAFAPGLVDTTETWEIAKGLAIRLGFDTGDILDRSPHCAYDGPMPADHAGAAVAYLVAVLADDFHGQKVSSYTVLERAGFIEPLQRAGGNVGPAADRGPCRDHATTIPIEVALSKRLQRLIDETDSEFNRLPIYVRPLMRRSFEAKTGQTIAEGRSTAANLTALLEGIGALDGTAEEIFVASYSSLKEWLGKLIDYYHNAPAEAAAFVRETGLLRDVVLNAPSRETSLRFLLDALERIAERAHGMSSTSLASSRGS